MPYNKNYRPHNPLVKKYADILAELSMAERGLVAQSHGLSVKALNALVQRMRWYATDARWFVAFLHDIEKTHLHIKRAMLPTKGEGLDGLEDEDEEEEVLVPIKRHIGGKRAQ